MEVGFKLFEKVRERVNKFKKILLLLIKLLDNRYDWIYNNHNYKRSDGNRRFYVDLEN